MEFLPSLHASELPLDCESRIFAEIRSLLQPDEKINLVFNVSTKKIGQTSAKDFFILNFCCVCLLLGLVVGLFLYGFLQDFLLTIAFALPAYMIIVTISTFIMYFNSKRTFKKFIAVYSIQGLDAYLQYVVITDRQIIFKNQELFNSNPVKELHGLKFIGKFAFYEDRLAFSYPQIKKIVFDSQGDAGIFLRILLPSEGAIYGVYWYKTTGAIDPEFLPKVLLTLRQIGGITLGYQKQTAKFCFSCGRVNQLDAELCDRCGKTDFQA